MGNIGKAARFYPSNVDNGTAGAQLSTGRGGASGTGAAIGGAGPSTAARSGPGRPRKRAAQANPTQAVSNGGEADAGGAQEPIADAEGDEEAKGPKATRAAS